MFRRARRENCPNKYNHSLNRGTLAVELGDVCHVARLESGEAQWTQDLRRCHQEHRGLDQSYTISADDGIISNVVTFSYNDQNFHHLVTPIEMSSLHKK